MKIGPAIRSVEDFSSHASVKLLLPVIISNPLYTFMYINLNGCQGKSAHKCLGWKIAPTLSILHIYHVNSFFDALSL